MKKYSSCVYVLRQQTRCHRLVVGYVRLKRFVVQINLVNSTDRDGYQMKALITLIGLTLAGACLNPVWSQESHSNSDKVLHAVRAREAIQIDGVLNDTSWALVSPDGAFVQRDPNQDQAPTESTTVQVLYDDEALYFGITLYDSQPNRIEKRLNRRDRPWDGDRVSVNIDPYHDHRTGYFFVVNAAGVEGDGLLFNDGNEDADWDGVWDSAVKITDRGWVAEIKIPYHTIRFTRQEKYTWGVNFIRDIYRNKERDFWAIVRRGENGWVSRFGHLEGIENISPPMRLQTVPYTVSKGQIAPVSSSAPKGNSVSQRFGGDVKYGLTSNMTLDMTFNPDFGQVEADENVLNLSRFESFFPEKRPFFLEGAQIFETPLGLFYSRRVGRAPTGSVDLRGGRLLDKSTATDIIGAAKLTGRTQRGTTIGLMSAVTAQEFAVVADSAAVRHRDLIEHRATYHVFRLKQDVMKSSSIGLIVTNAARSGGHPATSGGADWDLNFLNKMYSASGQVAWSRSGSGQRSTGMGTQIRFSKSGGNHLGLFVRYEGISPGFKINDLGFNRRANIHQFNASVNIRGNNPWRFTRRRNVNLNTNGSWNFTGTKLGQSVSVNTNVQFTNYWWMGGNVSRSFPVLDDLETSGAGLVRIPTRYNGFWWVESDFRRRVSGELNVEMGQERDGKEYSVGLFSRFQVAPNILIQFGPQYSWVRGVSRWVANVVDPGDPGTQIPVFGALATDNFNLVTRASITFTKDLSLSLYNQLFFAAGDYTGFKALTSPSTFGTLTSGLYTENPDFNSRSMNLNAVFRWEYRPGSTFFLVWTQARSGSGIPGDAAFGRNLRGVFSPAGQNVVLMKINYWWNI